MCYKCYRLYIYAYMHNICYNIYPFDICSNSLLPRHVVLHLQRLRVALILLHGLSQGLGLVERRLQLAAPPRLLEIARHLLFQPLLLAVGPLKRPGSKPKHGKNVGNRWKTVEISAIS